MIKKTLVVIVSLGIVFSAVHARELKPYKGNPAPPALNLMDLKGTTHSLGDYRGKVVLVNFWATWCPPCVHEMPSMQRLKEKMAGQAFTILAVDMAETDTEVKEFLKSRLSDKIDFTILMDKDGAALKAWKVAAFPTSFVLDPHGKIRYALFGALEWDDPNTVMLIKSLLSNNE